jgi:hypothetical protein
MQYLLHSLVVKIPARVAVEGPRPRPESENHGETSVAAAAKEGSLIASDDDSERDWFHESELQMGYTVVTSDRKYQWSEEVAPLKLFAKLRDKSGKVVKKDGKIVCVDMEMAKFTANQAKDVIAKNEKLERMFAHMVACILERLDENMCRKLDHCLRSPRLMWETLNRAFGDLHNPIAEGVYRWSRVMNLTMKHTDTFDSWNTKFNELWGTDTVLDTSFKHYRMLIKDNKDIAVKGCLPKRMHPAIDKAILDKMDLKSTIAHFLHYDGLFHAANEGMLGGMKDEEGDQLENIGAITESNMSMKQIKKLQYSDLCQEAKSARLWCSNCGNTRLHTADKCSIGITCRACGKTGHIARYCPRAMSGKGRGGGKPNGESGGNKSRNPPSSESESASSSDDDADNNKGSELSSESESASSSDEDDDDEGNNGPDSKKRRRN